VLQILEFGDGGFGDAGLCEESSGGGKKIVVEFTEIESGPHGEA
jgi:hypothetical protein